MALVVVGLMFAGCSGNDGAPGSSTAVLSGTVTNSMTSGPVPGAVVTTDPVVPGVTIVCDANGQYSQQLPIGNYQLTCQDANFVPGSGEVSLIANVPATVDFALDPVAAVVVNITGLPSTVAPGATFGLTANVTAMDGSTVTGYQWTQTASAQANIQNPTSQTATITLGDQDAYLAELISHLEILSRWRVLGINPFSLEEAGHVAFSVAVTTTSGTHNAALDVHTDLSAFAKVATGLRNVPVGVPVLLGGEDQATYDWLLKTRPAGSSATLANPATRFPFFTPDVGGIYEVTVTDLVDGVQTLVIYAGTWVGAITGQDGNGRPEAANCTICHTGAIDMFTPWKETGHAEIFTNNLNTSTHYGEGCFPCHTVGFDPDATNNGIDEQSDYQAFLSSGLINNPSSDNWTNTLANYPNTARMANIQCENCHGPNAGPSGQTAHMQHDPRVDLSADVCGSCHGEPKRHARFQQWELSGHANYELALDEGMSSSCAKCHTSNGLLAWLPILESGDDGPGGSSPSVTWTEDEIHPQTCATCHDPHNVGTTSGEGTNAPVRIQGSTFNLMSDFVVPAAGKGAMCMQCHNARRGARNDLVWPSITDRDRAPHGGPQTDVLMGTNGYFTDIGFFTSHGFVTNTCVACHMQLTDPPPELSYNLGGTNHTFEASDEICSNCHGAFDAQTIKASFEAGLHELELQLEAMLWEEINFQVGIGNTVEVAGLSTPDETTGLDISVVITDAALVTDIQIVESHGRQAMDITHDGVTYYHVQLGKSSSATDTSYTDVFVGGTPDPGGNDPGILDSANGQIIARAGWNYWLLHSDGSRGIHNPGFATSLINNSLLQLGLLDFTIP